MGLVSLSIAETIAFKKRFAAMEVEYHQTSTLHPQATDVLIVSEVTQALITAPPQDRIIIISDDKGYVELQSVRPKLASLSVALCSDASLWRAPR